MKSSLAALCFATLLCACATSRPDHFYILSTQPPAPAVARTAPVTQVSLRVTVPSLFDRAEIIMNTSGDGVLVLEHERWAAPLSDLMGRALARDLEGRRSDLLVSVVPGVTQSSDPVFKLAVDVVQLTVRQGQGTSIEAHWHIVDSRTGKDQLGGEVFSATPGQDDYAGAAQALSRCLGMLADRLAGQLQ